MKRSTKKIILSGLLAFFLMIPATSAIVGAERLGTPPEGRDAEAPEGVAPDRAGNLTYYTVEPCRLIDTRPSQGGGGPLPGGWYWDFLASGFCGVPYPEAKAVMVNIDAVDSWGTGNIRAFAYPTPLPFAAILTFGAVPQLGQGISNAAIIPICDANVDICYYDMTIWTSRTTDFVVDVMGYFR